MTTPRTFPSVGLIVFLSICLIMVGLIGSCRHAQNLEQQAIEAK